jgi:branched-chain amino acid transport system permease protein
MTHRMAQAGATSRRTAVAPPGPAPGATVVTIIAGALTLVGTLLPWATFVLNDGPYPSKATLEFFIEPLGLTGFRLHLELFAVAAVILALVPVAGRARILRALGIGVVAVTCVNLVYLVTMGGGFGTVTVSDGDVAFGPFVALAGGALLIAGAVRQRGGETPPYDWRLHPWIERGLLLAVFVLLLLLVSALLTSGGQDGAENVYSGAVFLSFLAAVGGVLAALNASGLLGWVAAVSERHRRFSALVLLACALTLPLTGAGTEYWLTVAANIGVYAVTAIGLNIVVGLAGLLDLGYVAFLGIGAFVAANLSGAAASRLGIMVPFPLVMVISALVAGVFGAIVGSPTLRVRGDYLAIVTLAFGEIFVRSAQNNIGGLTGGSNAIPGIPPVQVFGTSFDQAITVGSITFAPGVLYYVLIVAITAVVMVLFGNAKNSKLGRAWIAIREDEDAARAMGIRTGPIKILAFLIGAMLAGFAGAFFAHKTATVSYESFSFLESVTLLAAVILGGMGTIPGAVLGAAILFVLPEKLREFSDYRLLMFGIALILIMRMRPQGLVPDRHRRAEFTGKLRSRMKIRTNRSKAGS